MVQIPEEFPRSLNKGDLEEAGKLVDENWRLKSGLAAGISNDSISALYEKGIRAGAYGGKLVGAGGGGFLLFIVDPDKRQKVKEALNDLQEVEVGFDYNGSSIIYVGD